MLERSIAESLIHEAFILGADFCDIFVEKTQVETLSYYSEKIQDIKSGIDSGVGLRLIFGKQAIYGHTNSLELSKLMELLRTLTARYKSQNNQGLSDISFHSNLDLITEVKNKALKERIQFLNKVDQQTRSKNEKINQVNLSLLLKHQHVEIFNSEGLHVVDYRPYARLGATAIAQDGSLQADGSMSPGFSGGFEKIEEIDTGHLTNFISEQAMTMLHADPCPAGKMPVIIANGFGGVIFHEACGHSLETTAVQKKASEFWDKKGDLIANPCLNAVDDGTIDNLWGSLSIDDEGMATQKTQLIKDGRLENFLCDKLGSIKTEHPRTGSGRRQSYRFAPASRMRNTYIEPGESSLDEMLASIEDGVFAKSLGGGSVNPATGEFNFAVKEGYLVKGGKLQKAVKGATLIGKGAEIMKNITMVGNDLEYAAGMCGSVSGSIPVTVGQPAIKVEGILVGGSC